MATSDRIASFIIEMLEEAQGVALLQRSMLADKFGCVPSQINYVISTRFSPEHGYIVESRRGGGGYIRITRVRHLGSQLILHILGNVGGELDYRTASAYVSNISDAGVLDPVRGGLILAAVGDNALRPLEPESRDALRASIFKQMLRSLLSGNI